MLRMGYDRYVVRYQEILARHDPQETWDRLHQLAGGEEPVLLCWEDLKQEGKWCHRRMVAEWFQTELGILVPELGFEDDPDREPQPQQEELLME